MDRSLTLGGFTAPRILSFLAGAGMIGFSALTVEHYFAANFPESIYEGSFCDISAFFNCDSSAYSVIAQVGGVPLGYFGMFVGALVVLGTLFPSAAFERSNKSIALLNAIGVIALALVSVFVMGSLCLLCAGFYISSILSFVLFARYGIDGEARGFLARHVRPSIVHLATFAVLLAVGAYAFAEYHEARAQAQSGGVAASVVEEYFDLPEVDLPSFISPFWTTRATEEFADAPIHVVEYGDLLCSDCRFLHEQLVLLKDEFAGKLNVAFQFFPLDARCNAVVEKDLHPGACDLSYMAAHDPDKFLAIHDEVYEQMQAAKEPEWRAELAARHGVEAALEDPGTRDLVHRIINTGTEYESTSDEYAHGIRSTPTMIINGRMVIGTLPYEQLRAIFQAIVDRHEGRDTRRFLESWE